MAVRTLIPDWRWYHSPTCHMYEHVPAGTVYDGDLGAYLEQHGGADVEVLAPPKPPPAPPASVAVRPEPVAEPEPPAAPEPPSAVESDDGSDVPFDPAEHNTIAVLAYAKAHPDEAPAILAAERVGKQRMGVLGGLA